MPPTPIYVVTYAGEQLPGYAQTDDRPLSVRNVVNKVFGMDGASVSHNNFDMREITLTFLIKSRLTTFATGLQHLEDCMDQYRDSLAILMRNTGENSLRIHDSDRFYAATVSDISMPMEAGRSRSMVYSVKFLAQPFARGASFVTGNVTATGLFTLGGLSDSRRAYPTIEIPSTVTVFEAEDEHGHLVEFTRGSVPDTVQVNCAQMTVTNSSGVDVIRTLGSLNFRMIYEPNEDGEFNMDVTTFTGTGNVVVNIRPRYEL